LPVEGLVRGDPADGIRHRLQIDALESAEDMPADVAR
jgi:hypothetical protein